MKHTFQQYGQHEENARSNPGNVVSRPRMPHATPLLQELVEMTCKSRHHLVFRADLL